MSTPPRTTKEALFAEMLGDMDRMLSRIEKLPELVENCEQRLKDAAVIMQSAGEQYGHAVGIFTEQAKGELAGFLESESTEIIEKQALSIIQIAYETLFLDMKNIQVKAFYKQRKSIVLTILTHVITAFLSMLFVVYLL